MLPPVPFVRQVLLAVLAVVALTVGSASPSLAHTALASTTPADGAGVDEAPPEVMLQFTDEVIELGAVVSVTGPRGSVDVGPLTVSGATVTAGLPESLPGGSYSVDWRVSAADGHPISGTFSFSVVGTASSPTEAGGPPVSATAPAPGETAPARASGDTGVSAGAQPDDGAGSLVMWLFVGSAVVLALLFAAFVFLRSRRRR